MLRHSLPFSNVVCGGEIIYLEAKVSIQVRHFSFVIRFLHIRIKLCCYNLEILFTHNLRQFSGGSIKTKGHDSDLNG